MTVSAKYGLSILNNGSQETDQLMANSLFPEAKDKWKISLHIFNESVGYRTRRVEK